MACDNPDCFTCGGTQDAPKEDTPAPAGDITTWLDEDMRAELSRLRQENARLRECGLQLWNALTEKQSTLEDILGSREFVRWQRDRFVDGKRYFKDRFDTTVSELSSATAECERLRGLLTEVDALARFGGWWPVGLEKKVRAALSTPQQPGGEGGKKGDATDD